MLLITGSKWIDVIAEQVHDGDWAVLESGVFERAESSPLDNACPRLDARGMYLVPGLIDAHVHLGRPRAPSPVEQLPLDRHVEQVARATLAGGITTVRDLGDRWPRGKHVAAAARKLKGPHVVSALAGITAPGGYGAFLGEATRDKDDLMRAVRRRHEAGASVIKLFLTGGVDFASSAVSAPQFEYDTLSLAAAAARERGMMLAVHANGAEAVLLAVRAGADTIEHGLLIDGDGLRAMADKGVYWIPTLAPLRRALDLGGDGPLLAGLRVVLRRHMEAVARGYDLGVKVVAGTDAALRALRTDVWPEKWRCFGKQDYRRAPRSGRPRLGRPSRLASAQRRGRSRRDTAPISCSCGRTRCATSRRLPGSIAWAPAAAR